MRGWCGAGLGSLRAETLKGRWSVRWAGGPAAATKLAEAPARAAVRYPASVRARLRAVRESLRLRRQRHRLRPRDAIATRRRPLTPCRSERDPGNGLRRRLQHPDMDVEATQCAAVYHAVHWKRDASAMEQQAAATAPTDSSHPRVSGFAPAPTRPELQHIELSRQGVRQEGGERRRSPTTTGA